MLQNGVNLAVTKGGAAYNKLSRPEIANDSQPPRPTSESTKRKLTELDIVEQATDDEPYIKRLRPGVDAAVSTKEATPVGTSSTKRADRLRWEEPRYFKNETFGQASLLPVAHDGSDDESSDEVTAEAMRYLQSVRSQALELPNFFSIPKNPAEERTVDESTYEPAPEDAQFYFDDGAFVALDDDEYTYEGNADVVTGNLVQHLCHKRMLDSFQALRETTRNASPVGLLEYLKSTGGDSKPPPRGAKEWHYVLRTEAPTPALLYQLDSDDALHGLSFSTQFIKLKNIPETWSCWIWSLLAKLDDVGSMSTEKISIVRELGKKAATFATRFNEQTLQDLEEEQDEEDADEWDAAALDHEETNGDYDTNESSEAGMSNDLSNEAAGRGGSLHAEVDGRNGDDDFEAAKARLLSVLDSGNTETPAPESRSRKQKPHGDGRHRNSFSPSSPEVTAPWPKKLLSRAEAEAERQKLVKEQSKEGQHKEEQSKEEQGQVKQKEPYNTKVDEKVTFPDDNTRATVDMILTIVGECFGQRDLLDCREVWYAHFEE